MTPTEKEVLHFDKKSISVPLCQAQILRGEVHEQNEECGPYSNHLSDTQNFKLNSSHCRPLVNTKSNITSGLLFLYA
jgi:hypothetical protein